MNFFFFVFKLFFADVDSIFCSQQYQSIRILFLLCLSSTSIRNKFSPHIFTPSCDTNGYLGFYRILSSCLHCLVRFKVKEVTSLSLSRTLSTPLFSLLLKQNIKSWVKQKYQKLPLQTRKQS